MNAKVCILNKYAIIYMLYIYTYIYNRYQKTKQTVHNQRKKMCNIAKVMQGIMTKNYNVNLWSFFR